jgi:hypothetical protein
MFDALNYLYFIKFFKWLTVSLGCLLIIFIFMLAAFPIFVTAILLIISAFTYTVLRNRYKAIDRQKLQQQLKKYDEWKRQQRDKPRFGKPRPMPAVT